VFHRRNTDVTVSESSVIGRYFRGDESSSRTSASHCSCASSISSPDEREDDLTAIEAAAGAHGIELLGPPGALPEG
jgi:hypothetical protein